MKAMKRNVWADPDTAKARIDADAKYIKEVEQGKREALDWAATLEAYIDALEAENKDLLAACEQKQEIINAFKTELEDTVTECMAEKSNNDIRQARIEALEAERGWRKFTTPKELPANYWHPYYSDVVLVAIKDGTNRFVKEERYNLFGERWEKYSTGVTHWMPLPEPPEGE